MEKRVTRWSFLEPKTNNNIIIQYEKGIILDTLSNQIIRSEY